MGIIYCGICTLPPEYCEFNSGNTYKKCKPWLQQNHVQLFNQLYPEEAVASTLESMSIDALPSAQEQPTTDEQPPADTENTNKPLTKQERAKQAALKVTLKRVERTKRKRVIHITGMETYQVDLKKAAKLFANKFACGCSVTKNAAGKDEIVVQGDVMDQLLAMIPKEWPAIDSKQLVVQESAKKKASEQEQQ